MRILHVVSLISSDGAFGGPTRVCQNQSQALGESGHEVTVVAGARGEDFSARDLVDGVRTVLFKTKRLPGLGFAGLFAPGMTRWLLRNSGSFDVAHVHLARDLVTLPAALTILRSGTPVIVQPHGMIDSSQRLLARPIDAWGTRPVLRRARFVLALNEKEGANLQEVAHDIRQTVVLPNGVPEQVVPVEGVQTRATEVLYLARLHVRKRPLYFVKAAKQLSSRFPATRFTLVGPDEGEGAAVQSAIGPKSSTTSWEGPIDPTRSLDRMANSDIYVLPAVDEPFGMTVLEAMSLGKPVIITESCGLAAAVRHHRAGLVTKDDPEALAEAIAHLLDNPAERQRMGERGRAAVKKDFSMTSVAARLSEIYQQAVEQAR